MLKKTICTTHMVFPSWFPSNEDGSNIIENLAEILKMMKMISMPSRE
jgi:hypothetical protein